MCDKTQEELRKKHEKSLCSWKTNLKANLENLLSKFKPKEWNHTFKFPTLFYQRQTVHQTELTQGALLRGLLIKFFLQQSVLKAVNMS